MSGAELIDDRASTGYIEIVCVIQRYRVAGGSDGRRNRTVPHARARAIAAELHEYRPGAAYPCEAREADKTLVANQDQAFETATRAIEYD